MQDRVCRWTAPREAVLDLLSRTSEHLSAKEIYATLHRKDPSIGLTTVYRTLDLVNSLGFIHKIIMSNGQARYEFRSDKSDDHHHHLICTRCDRIIDYSEFEKEELELIKKTEARLSRKYKFQIFDHSIEFFGLCDECRQQTEPSEPINK
ncbi:MAG: transcriptional repressor [Candidatus Aminicenantes bacterium]|nr:transcriptional repressor [Candidatus Aminicenantes bacterium]